VSRDLDITSRQSSSSHSTAKRSSARSADIQVFLETQVDARVTLGKTNTDDNHQCKSNQRCSRHTRSLCLCMRCRRSWICVVIIICRRRDCGRCYVKPRGDPRCNCSGPNARRRHTLCRGDVIAFRGGYRQSQGLQCDGIVIDGAEVGCRGLPKMVSVTILMITRCGNGSVPTSSM
jgi:hypothetical protein